MVFTVEEIKTKTVPVAVEYGVDSMSLFGSYARGEATDDSDVDILISRGEIQDLFEYSGFINALEDSLGCHVDVVSMGISDKSFLTNIMKDEVLLYSKS